MAVMAVEKTSIALPREDLVAARRAADAEGLSLSAFLVKLVREHVARQSRFEAMDRFVKTYAPKHRLTPRAKAAIEAEWEAPLEPIRPRRRRRAA